VTDDYYVWNAALTARFLQDRPGEPLYLYTDDAVLQEVAGEVGVDASQATSSFSRAVVDTLQGQEPFRRWAFEARRFAQGDGAGPPPYFAVLCFLVLVAVERETTRFQYYPELNQHLGRPAAQGAPPGFTEHVFRLFSSFNDWLRGPGAVHGTPTAVPPEHLPNVGWPLSQALVRPTDRAHLVRIFAAMGLTPGRATSVGSLRARVVPRLRTSTASSSQARLVHLYQQHPETFDELLQREFEAWDGSSTADVGPKSVQLRLCYDESFGEWWFLAPPVSGAEGRGWRIGSATGQVNPFKGLEATPAELWQLVGGGTVGQIDHGPALVSQRRPHRWLSLDLRAGGWAEVAQRDLSMDQLVLVSRSDPGFGSLEGVKEIEAVTPGFDVYAVAAGVDVDALGAPSPVKVQEARLDGGLCLNRATHTYLHCKSGAPQLVGALRPVLVDGEPFEPREGTLDLAALHLGEGTHEVRGDGTTIHFRLVGEVKVGPSDEPVDSWIDGMTTSDRLAIPHDRGNVWLIGTNGEAEERKPVSPAWLTDLGLLRNQVDVSALIRNAAFPPAYVVSPSYMGKPWVQAVPGAYKVSTVFESPRPLNLAAARMLVEALLVDYRPSRMREDRAWKRALAAFLRTAHQ
jgi:hypothetical protein